MCVEKGRAAAPPCRTCNIGVSTSRKPFSVKVLRAWLAQHGVTGLTIKKRGVRLDDDELRRQLRIGRKAGSGRQATVILTRVAGQQAVLVVDPA